MEFIHGVREKETMEISDIMAAGTLKAKSG